MKNGIFVLCLALRAAVSAAPAPIPATPVETLAGKRLDVSRDIAPGRAVLIIGFTKASRAQTAEWSRRLEPERLRAAATEVYQVAVLADVPWPFKSFAARSIRSSVPESMHAHFLLALEGADHWRRLVGFDDADSAYVLSLRGGEVQWRGAGKLTEARYQSLVQSFGSPGGAAAPDANRLRTGRFVYRIRKEKAEVARFTITIRKLPDGNFRFTGEAAGFHQNWESIATRTFEPVSASLQLQRSSGETLSMTLAYGGGRVTGSSTTAGGIHPGAIEKAIDAAIAEGTVDQRIDWAAALSGPLDAGRSFRFAVYDPATGVSPVEASVGKTERVEVPAGTYAAARVVYRIEKSKGTESYEVLASPDTPRMMVREDFPDGTVTELLEAFAQ